MQTFNHSNYSKLIKLSPTCEIIKIHVCQNNKVWPKHIWKKYLQDSRCFIFLFTASRISLQSNHMIYHFYWLFYKINHMFVFCHLYIPIRVLVSDLCCSVCSVLEADTTVNWTVYLIQTIAQLQWAVRLNKLSCAVLLVLQNWPRFCLYSLKLCGLFYSFPSGNSLRALKVASDQSHGNIWCHLRTHNPNEVGEGLMMENVAWPSEPVYIYVPQFKEIKFRSDRIVNLKPRWIGAVLNQLQCLIMHLSKCY